MKKVIGGALYNTDTARNIGEWWNGLSRSDFSHCSEELFQTKSGKYFLYGEGGPMSKYARSDGDNSWSGGEHIEPLTPQAAREWAEKHLEVGKYSAEFGEPEEAADGRVTLNLTVPAEVKARLEKLRSEMGKSISQIIVEKFGE